MKKLSILLASLFLMYSVNLLKAQHTLQFNRVLIVDENLQTVPTGTVWKVVAVYGNSPKVCIEHPNRSTESYKYNWFNVQGFKANGVNIFSEMRYAGNFNSNYGHYWYVTIDCTSSTSYDYITTWGAYDVNPNPNILPMWLPENTTLQAMQGSYLSVIEFIVN